MPEEKIHTDPSELFAFENKDAKREYSKEGVPLVNRRGPKPDEKKYVIKETRVDKHNTRRDRIELTPAVCDECGFDFAMRNFNKPYDMLDGKTQQLCIQHIQEHKDRIHGLQDKFVISESEMRRKFLGRET